MGKHDRSSIAVSQSTAKALKVLADEIGTTVGDMLHIIVTHKPDVVQRAYVQGDRLAKAARLVELGQRRMAAASGSGSRSASSAPPASASASARSASSAPAALAGSTPVAVPRPPRQS